MISQGNERCTVYACGQKFELWENPEFSFPASEKDLAERSSPERWVLLFNMMVLNSDYFSFQEGLEC